MDWRRPKDLAERNKKDNQMNRLLIVAVTLFLGISSAFANDYLNSVSGQMSGISDELAQEGWVFDGMTVGKLDEGMSEQWTGRLGNYLNYRIVAVCDQDCTDVDLTLSKNGAIIDSDEESDDFPVVSLNNARDGDYSWAVTMYSCSEEPCYYAIGVFVKQ